MTMSARCLLYLFYCAVALFSGCRLHEEQDTVESKTIFQIIKALQNYEIDHPQDRVTNLVQLFEASGKPYPNFWHEEFSRYGKNAGFKRSIYEKYIFFSPGITNRLFEGELFLMNARPYPGPGGERKRNIVSKIGHQFYWRTLQESAVQRIFQEAGIAEPKPIEMPAPNQTSGSNAERWFVSSQRYFRDVAWKMGIGPAAWWIVALAYALGFLLLGLVAYLLIRCLSREK